MSLIVFSEIFFLGILPANIFLSRGRKRCRKRTLLCLFVGVEGGNYI
jgi:hypothetical protein